MTTKEIVDRLVDGEKITLKELHRLERRLAGLYRQVEAIEDAVRGCYDVRDGIRVPNRQVVEV